MCRIEFDTLALDVAVAAAPAALAVDAVVVDAAAGVLCRPAALTFWLSSSHCSTGWQIASARLPSLQRK